MGFELKREMSLSVMKMYANSCVKPRASPVIVMTEPREEIETARVQEQVEQMKSTQKTVAFSRNINVAQVPLSQSYRTIETNLENENLKNSGNISPTAEQFTSGLNREVAAQKQRGLASVTSLDDEMDYMDEEISSENNSSHNVPPINHSKMADARNSSLFNLFKGVMTPASEEAFSPKEKKEEGRDSDLNRAEEAQTDRYRVNEEEVKYEHAALAENSDQAKFQKMFSEILKKYKVIFKEKGMKLSSSFSNLQKIKQNYKQAQDVTFADFKNDIQRLIQNYESTESELIQQKKKLEEKERENAELHRFERRALSEVKTKISPLSIHYAQNTSQIERNEEHKYKYEERFQTERVDRSLPTLPTSQQQKTATKYFNLLGPLEEGHDSHSKQESKHQERNTRPINLSNSGLESVPNERQNKHDKFEEIETDIELGQSLKSTNQLLGVEGRHDYALVNQGKWLPSNLKEIIESDLNSLQNLAAALGKTGDQLESFCRRVKAPLFTDLVVYFSEEQKQEKRIILIKGTKLYFLTPNASHKLVEIPLAKIDKIQILHERPGMLLISLTKYHTYLLNSSNRLELALFVHTHQQLLHLPPAQILVNGPQKVNGVDRALSLDVSKRKQISSSLLKFWNQKAIKAGYLWVFVLEGEKQPQNCWSQKIVMLTKVGLLIYDSLQSQQSRFTPVLNAKLAFPTNILVHPNIKEDLGGNSKHEFHLLEITSLEHRSVTLLFSNEKQCENWVEQIKELQEVYKNEELRLLEGGDLQK